MRAGVTRLSARRRVGGGEPGEPTDDRLAGRLAQRPGTRWVMSVAAIVAAGSGAVYALPLGATGLMAARVGTGVAEALLMTAGAVWAVSLAPPHRRGQIVGLYGMSMWGGLSAAAHGANAPPRRVASHSGGVCRRTM